MIKVALPVIGVLISGKAACSTCAYIFTFTFDMFSDMK